MSIIFIYISILITLTSCNYQNGLGLFIGDDEVITDRSKLKSLDCTSSDTYSDFHNNLTDFYSQFVLEDMQSVDFDTRIDYQSMLDLKLQFDLNFKLLRCSIRIHIAKEDLTARTDC